MAAQAPPLPPLPVVDDRDTGGFFEAAGRGELVIRECLDCGFILHLPRAICEQCHSSNTAWRTVRPRGRIYSYSTLERQAHPAFPAPYTVILVELDDVPHARLAGSLPGIPDIAIGMPVSGYFETVGDAPILRWSLATGPDS